MLEKGTIVEEGSYEELMNKNGKFAALVRKQMIQSAQDA
jgi:ABC-type multidrug transport system fused ATPase/permease subunit